jgi:hypothetical protein
VAVVGSAASAAAECAFSMALLSISKRFTFAAAGTGVAASFDPPRNLDQQTALSLPPGPATCTNGAGYTPAVCVSFTIPKPGLGKLRVCLEN